MAIGNIVGGTADAPYGLPHRDAHQPTMLQEVIEDMEALIARGEPVSPKVVGLWRSTLRSWSPESPDVHVPGWSVRGSREEWEAQEKV